MCLIIYSPNGDLIPRRVFDYARYMNGNGVGIMSARGVEKFVGRKSGKRAWRYLRRLAEDGGVAYGLHFRWATHGDVTLANCHPFSAPGSDAIVMHNGVIARTAKYATRDRSDTRIFVEQYMTAAPDQNARNYGRFYNVLERFIGDDNKLLVYHQRTHDFTICNEDQGEWIDGFWYSNDYSLPYDMTADGKKWPRFDDWRAADHMRAETPTRSLILSLMRSQHMHVTAEQPRNEYADRNVSDAVDRASMSAYYTQLESETGYYDDGTEVGTRAAVRSMIERDDAADLRAYLKRSGYPESVDMT